LQRRKGLKASDFRKEREIHAVLVLYLGWVILQVQNTSIRWHQSHTGKALGNHMAHLPSSYTWA
jgi:hypothetical protein